MHDVSGCATRVLELVSCVEAGARLGHDVRREPRRQVKIAGGSASREARDGLAFEVLHDDEEVFVVLPELVNVDDVRMPHRCGDRGLVEEHRHEARVAREVRVDALDDDRLFEALRSGEPAEEDLRHAAAVEPSHDVVAAHTLW